MIGEYFLFAVNSIRHRKLRSWLTILGIVIGVAAIISLIMISRGLERSIEEQFSQFGANRILMSAKGFQGPGTQSEGLTLDDVETVEKIGGFEYVTPAIFRQAEVSHNKEVAFTLVGGIPAEQTEQFIEDTSVELAEGRFIKAGDKLTTIVGSRVASEMFDKHLTLGSKLEIGGKEFRIIGIWEESGNAQEDNRINIPLETAQEIFKTGNKIDTMVAQVKTGGNIKLIQDRIERALERERGNTNFQVLTPDQIVEQINQILGIMQIVLVGIATISLVVGAIGIMNSMYTSVLERTKDIGIMKAIGARNSDILQIFLIESGLMGFVGGLFGTAIGAGIAFFVERIAANAGFPLSVEIEAWLLLFGLGFAFIVGVGSGMLPAYQASRLKPVDALRYE